MFALFKTEQQKSLEVLNSKIKENVPMVITILDERSMKWERVRETGYSYMYVTALASSYIIRSFVGLNIYKYIIKQKWSIHNMHNIQNTHANQHMEIQLAFIGLYFRFDILHIRGWSAGTIMLNEFMRFLNLMEWFEQNRRRNTCP